MALIQFPFQLRPRDVDFFSSAATGPNQLTLTGKYVLTLRDAGVWRSRVVVEVDDEETVLAARAFAAQITGGIREVLLPAMPQYRPRTRAGDEIPRFNTGPLGQSMFNHVGIRHAEPVYMTVEDNAKLRDTQLKIRHPGMQGLRPGHFFGIGDRLHIVSNAWFDSIEYEHVIGGRLGYRGNNWVFGPGNNLIFGTYKTRTRGEAVQNIQFWPPLREKVAAGEQILVGSPMCKMILENPEEALPRLDRGISGRFELLFRESV